jgi:hypothetical protein
MPMPRITYVEIVRSNGRGPLDLYPATISRHAVFRDVRSGVGQWYPGEGQRSAGQRSVLGVRSICQAAVPRCASHAAVDHDSLMRIRDRNCDLTLVFPPLMRDAAVSRLILAVVRS